MSTLHTHREFFTDLLTSLDLPVRTAGLRAFAAVSIFESSEGNNPWNNPLACTNYWPGAVPYNTFGNQQHVWEYATFADGVAATAALYRQPHWDGVRSAVKSSWTRGPILDAFTAAYTWAAINFRTAPFNTVDQLRARLNHPLYGPQGS